MNEPIGPYTGPLPLPQTGAAPRQRKWIKCPACRYPLVLLHDFEGISSRDAPGCGGAAAQDFWIWGWFYDLTWGTVSRMRRRRQAKKLREEVLPRYPNSQVCPQCMFVNQIE